MTTHDKVRVSVLGLGEMGRALAGALVKDGHTTTVWNRSPGKADDLVAQGAERAATARDAVRASPLVIACLLDHASVHEVLDPLAGELAGRTLINVTTTSPAQSRELAAWAADAGVTYLDGGIMAVPDMIGRASSSVLYSGSADAFDRYKPLLDTWGTSTYFGEDAGPRVAVRPGAARGDVRHVRRLPARRRDGRPVRYEGGRVRRHGRALAVRHDRCLRGVRRGHRRR
ncbi:NAD(P)-binding domain-containing protein [Streptomyces sp. UP1A-1]|nr:NAD(P)-binding domain-containing protein [Streptomyces sp. UP1A-1]